MFMCLLSLLLKDILVGCVLLMIVFGAFFYYQKGKLKSATVYGTLVVVVLFDLWRVAMEALGSKGSKGKASNRFLLLILLKHCSKTPPYSVY